MPKESRGRSNREKSPRSTGTPGDRPRPKTDANEFAGMGIAMGLSIALFAVGGNWLDGRLGTAPLFVLIGVFLGFGGGFYSVYSKLILSRKDEDEGRPGE